MPIVHSAGKGGSGSVQLWVEVTTRLSSWSKKCNQWGVTAKVLWCLVGCKSGFPISLVLCAPGHQAWNLSLQSGSLPLLVTRQDTQYSSNILQSVRVVSIA